MITFFPTSLYDLRVRDLESSFWFLLDIYVENRLFMRCNFERLTIRSAGRMQGNFQLLLIIASFLHLLLFSLDLDLIQGMNRKNIKNNCYHNALAEFSSKYENCRRLRARIKLQLPWYVWWKWNENKSLIILNSFAKHRKFSLQSVLGQEMKNVALNQVFDLHFLLILMRFFSLIRLYHEAHSFRAFSFPGTEHL